MTAPGRPLLVVVGPTASGKSEIAEGVAARLPAQLVSADALQVYRGLDIGTAKPTAETRHRVRYHCLDLFDATGRCTAGAFGRAAQDAVNAIRAAGDLPVLVGGSGFYIQAAVFGIDPLPPSDPRWRAALEAIGERRGVTFLHGALRRLDPQRAEDVGVRDGQRILRSLEVILRTGRRVAQLAAATGSMAPEAGRPQARLEALGGRTIWVGATWPRATLGGRIERRVDAMLAAGWLDEVAALLRAGVPVTAHSLQAIGYRQLVDVVAGKASLREARTAIVQATRQYAKRQMSWFRRNPDIEWLELGGDRCGSIEAATAHAVRRAEDAGP